MPNPQPLDLSWLGGAIGGAISPGRDTNAGGSVYGGQRNLLKDMLEGAGTASDERFAADAKLAKTLRSLYEQQGDRMGMPGLKDRAHTMSLSELEGTMKSYLLGQAQDEKEQRDKERTLGMKALVQNMRLNEDKALLDRAGQAQTGEFYRAMQPPTWQQAMSAGPTNAAAASLTETPENRLLRALATYPAAKPDASIMRYLSGTERAGTPLEVREVTLPSGNKVAVGGQRWDFLPDATTNAPRNRLAESEYHRLGGVLTQLEKEFNATTNYDERNRIVGEMNRVKRQRAQFTTPTTAAPATPSNNADPLGLGL